MYRPPPGSVSMYVLRYLTGSRYVHRSVRGQAESFGESASAPLPNVRKLSKFACRCLSEEIGGQQLKNQTKCGPSDESGCVFVSACRMMRVISDAFTPVVSTVEAFYRCKRSTFPRRGFSKQRLSPDQSRSFSQISESFCVQDVLD